MVIYTPTFLYIKRHRVTGLTIPKNSCARQRSVACGSTMVRKLVR